MEELKLPKEHMTLKEVEEERWKITVLLPKEKIEEKPEIIKDQRTQAYLGFIDKRGKEIFFILDGDLEYMLRQRDYISLEICRSDGSAMQTTLGELRDNMSNIKKGVIIQSYKQYKSIMESCGIKPYEFPHHNSLRKT